MDYLDHLSEFAARIEFGALAPALQEQALWILADTAAAIVAATSGYGVRSSPITSSLMRSVSSSSRAIRDVLMASSAV